MSVFDTAMQVLFADKNLAIDATFIPTLGANKEVRVVTRAPDLYQNIGQSVVQTPSFVLEVRVIDCPTLVAGDLFLINKIKYVVQGAPRRDSERLTWQVDCYEA